MKTAQNLSDEIIAMLAEFGQPLTLQNIRGLQGIINSRVPEIQLSAAKRALEMAEAKIKLTIEQTFSGTVSMNQYGEGVKAGMIKAKDIIPSLRDNLTTEQLEGKQ